MERASPFFRLKIFVMLILNHIQEIGRIYFTFVSFPVMIQFSCS